MDQLIQPTRLSQTRTKTSFLSADTAIRKLGPTTESSDKVGLKGTNPSAAIMLVVLVPEGTATSALPTIAQVRAGQWDEYVPQNSTWFHLQPSMDAYGCLLSAVDGDVYTREYLR